MDILTIKIYHDKLISLVSTDFQRELLNASLNNLLDKENKLRFNNFSYGIRELSRHILITLAPNEEVVKCLWFKNETKKVGQPSRGERIKYAIQGGLPDAFVSKFFDIEDYKTDVLDAIELLNKYTHVNENTFDISEKDVIDFTSLVVKAFDEFVIAINDCRKHLRDELEQYIDEALIDHTISESIDEIDILSTHHSIESVETSHFHIKDLKSEYLSIDASGFIDVNQQYGSNSDLRRGNGHEQNTSFTFTSRILMTISETFPDQINLESFAVDTDDWYEE